jgi:cell division protein FtsB
VVKTLADMHVAPAVRRWALRLGLAIVVAIAIGYLPGGMLRRDPRAIKLEQQLAAQRDEARELAAGNARLAREIEAQRTDVQAIERRARADLGLVYPGELVMRIRRQGDL